VTVTPLDAARDALIALQGQLAADNARLAARVAGLEERLARLERAASRNSGNSSMPPSTDDQPGRTSPAPRPGRGEKGQRRPGKQPGAPGWHLAWSEHPDDTVPHFPEGACGCGRDLAGARDLGVAASHQQIDIPLAAARVVQHDLHEAACACGWVHRAAPPAGAGAPGTVTCSVQLQAWCVFLIVAHHVPVHRAAQIIESLTGAKPSPGFVHALIARAAAAAAQVNKLIRALIIAARVVCADETPIRCGPGRSPASGTCWWPAPAC
jgi:transposase